MSLPSASGNPSNAGVNCTFYKRKGEALKRQLDGIKTFLTSAMLLELNSAALTVWLEEVERAERNFDSVQTKLEELDHLELEGDARSKFFASYIDIKTAIIKEQSERQATERRQSFPARQSSFDEPPSFIISQPKLRLPPLQIPKFSGSYTEWPDFYSMFCSVVDRDSELTNIERFQHLRSSLKDSALDTIRSLEISDTNYKKALELLINRFDNKRLNFQAHIREIFALKQVESGSVSKLRELSDKVKAHLRAVQTMATKEQLADCMLIHLISSKLDTASQTKWEEETPTSQIPAWDSMARFLEKRCQRLENVELALVTQTPGHQVGKKFICTNNNRKAFIASTKICSVCNSHEHAIQQCPKFLGLSPSLRYKEVKRLQLCLNCLNKGHLIKTCTSGCCRHCSAKHHSLLHLNSTQLQTLDVASSFSSPEPNKLLPNASAQSTFVSASSFATLPTNSPTASPQNFVLLATAIVHVKNRAGSLVPCRALLDSASQLNFITCRLGHQLQLKRSKVTTLISGIGKSEFVADHIIDLCMHSRIGEYATSLSAVVTPSITDFQPNCSLGNIDWSIPTNISLADPLFFESQRIDLLIGAGLFFELLCVGQIRLQEHLPLLQKTRLGWVVAGGGQSTSRGLACLASIDNNFMDESDDLNRLVEQFWAVENSFQSGTQHTKEELDCETHFAQNVLRLDSGEYSVRLPMKNDPSQLGDSYHLALQRFKALERKLKRNNSLREQYLAFIKEYIDLKHMSLVSIRPNNTPTYFLPHHCVLKQDSTTTKLRVVFDGSAASSTGHSLNDILMSGPTIQAKLFDTLLRFRSFKIALTADIAKMYRCVRVLSPDSLLQCILWRDTPEDEIKVYKLDTVTYGTKPASFLAIRTMHQLASDEQLTYPLGAKIVRRDFYVDDMISGGNSLEEVLEIKSQTSALLASGNFTLRKWCTNDSEVLSRIPECERQIFLKFHDGSEVTKTLGLIWDPKTDCFLFSFVPISTQYKRITKRNILSVIARFYDPLGSIGPVIAKAKILLQRLWKEKLHWDESLPQKLQNEWLDICEGFHFIDKLKFSRFFLLPHARLQVHAFCDASLSAYGACVYITAESCGQIKSNLLCSKSRVSPLKTLTVPKLELCAALLLATLINSVANLNIFGSEFHCWSDSTVVLSWLRGEPSNYKIFVSNRVSSIQALTKHMSWHYVPTNLNPADILSRGASPMELSKSTLWKHGPCFLQLSSSEWPTDPALVRDQPERRQIAMLSTAKTIDLSANCKYVNSFPKMQRIYAYMNRFCRAIGCKNERRTGLLTTIDIQLGTKLLLRMIQKVYLASDYRALTSNGEITSSSELYSLRPFIDSEGLLRVGGRLENSSLDFESKHPIILPKGHMVTVSLIDHFHKKMLHAGPQAVLAAVRLQYWPLGGRKTVASVINKCIRCFRVKPRTTEHLMGDLPADRVHANRAFLVTGMDFCGPFAYRSDIQNKPSTKCYVCLFICFSTKAVHLELVSDLSTPSFLAALKRFICTRGKPKIVWSDNATNFVGAKNELAELKRLFFNDNNFKAIHQQCLDDGIDFRFIPPRSPHFGGLWEASIKIAKFHFWRVVGLSTLNFDELRTLIAQISAIMNSRPLCPLTENPEDLDVLTPAHFLIGSAFTSLIEPDVSELNINRLDRWQRVCYMQQVFWRKWSTEYLTLLQQRSKWRSNKPNIEVGAMVLVKDENLPPLKWPLARVIETIKGNDSVVRVVVLRTANGTTRRAVAKLCALPVDTDAVESLHLPTGGGCLEKQ